MIEAAINGALPRGIEFNGNALAIAQFKTPSSPLSDTRPTIELMRSININELRRVIPRYSNTINEPNVSLKYPDIARLRLSPFSLEITHYFRARTMLPYRMGYDLFRPTSC
jgi:hypothetical protein